MLAKVLNWALACNTFDETLCWGAQAPVADLDCTFSKLQMFGVTVCLT